MILDLAVVSISLIGYPSNGQNIVAIALGGRKR